MTQYQEEGNPICSVDSFMKNSNFKTRILSLAVRFGVGGGRFREQD